MEVPQEFDCKVNFKAIFSQCFLQKESVEMVKELQPSGNNSSRIIVLAVLQWRITCAAYTYKLEYTEMRRFAHRDGRSVMAPVHMATPAACPMWWSAVCSRPAVFLFRFNSSLSCLHI